MCGCKRHYQRHGECTCRCQSHSHLRSDYPRHRAVRPTNEMPYPHGFEPRHCGCLMHVAQMVGGRA